MTNLAKRRLLGVLAIAVLACVALGFERYRRHCAVTREAREWSRLFVASRLERDAPGLQRRVQRFSEADWNYLLDEAARPDTRFEKWLQGAGPLPARVRSWVGIRRSLDRNRSWTMVIAWLQIPSHPEDRKLALIDAAARAEEENVTILLDQTISRESMTPRVFARLRQVALSKRPWLTRIYAALALVQTHTADDPEMVNLTLALERDPDTNVASAIKLLNGWAPKPGSSHPPDRLGQTKEGTNSDGKTTNLSLPTTLLQRAR